MDFEMESLSFWNEILRENANMNYKIELKSAKFQLSTPSFNGFIYHCQLLKACIKDILHSRPPYSKSYESLRTKMIQKGYLKWYM